MVEILPGRAEFAFEVFEIHWNEMSIDQGCLDLGKAYGSRSSCRFFYFRIRVHKQIQPAKTLRYLLLSLKRLKYILCSMVRENVTLPKLVLNRFLDGSRGVSGKFLGRPKNRYMLHFQAMIIQKLAQNSWVSVVSRSKLLKILRIQKWIHKFLRIRIGSRRKARI